MNDDDLDAARAELAEAARANEQEAIRLELKRRAELEEIRAELARRGVRAPDEPCELSLEVAEVAAEFARRDAERFELQQRIAEAEANPALALAKSLDALAAILGVALTQVLAPKPAPVVVKTVERNAEGDIIRIIEEVVAE